MRISLSLSKTWGAVTGKATFLEDLLQGANTLILREASWLAGGVLLKAVAQLGTLYCLTRTLNVEQVGTFFAILSLFALVVPFIQLGTYDITVREIARREQPALVAGRAMQRTTATFLLLFPIVLLLKRWIPGEVSWTAFLLLAVSELFITCVLTNVMAVATGFRLHYVAALSDLLAGWSRFAAIYVAWQLGGGLNLVLILYAFTSLPATYGAYSWMVRRIGRPVIPPGPITADLKDHMTMLCAWVSEMAARSGDKLLLAEFAGAFDTGIYGAATRLFGIALVPIDILTQVFRPRIGRAYADGGAIGTRLWLMTAACLGGLGLIAGVGVVLIALILPRVMPSLVRSDFAEVRLALLYLAFVPALYGLQRATVIDAIARSAIRAYAVGAAVGAGCGVATLIGLAPAYGWRAGCIGLSVYFAMSALATWVLSRYFSNPLAHESKSLLEVSSGAALQDELEAAE
jgi:O-antigen/teichoic acid export membrane protein